MLPPKSVITDVPIGVFSFIRTDFRCDDKLDIDELDIDELLEIENVVHGRRNISSRTVLQ